MTGQEAIISVVGQNELLSRRDIANRVGRSVNGAFISALERAVASGRLHKMWCAIGHNSGWGYCQPEAAPRMFEVLPF